VVPGRAWIHLPITAGYDRYPELLVEEKTALLGDLEQRGARLYFMHDPEIALARIAKDARGRFHSIDEQRELRELAA
jgi:hypothetical protein